MNTPSGRPTRRQFVFHGGTLLGAGMAAAAGATGSVAGTEAAATADTCLALQQLQARLLAALAQGDSDALPGLFTDDAVLRFDALSLQGRSAIADWLAARAEGAGTYHRAYRQAALRPQDELQLSARDDQATLRFHVEAEACTPLSDDCTAAQMARLQGCVADSRWESGLFEARLQRQAQGWRLAVLSYRVA